MLDHLLERGLIPPLPLRLKVDHYSYIGSRPDARSRLRPGHPDRIEGWSKQFAAIRAVLAGGAPRPAPAKRPSPTKEARPVTKNPRPSRNPTIKVPEFVRDGIRAGLTPDQIFARNGRRRAIYLAGIIEEARQKEELAAFEATPANVQLLRDKHGHRWERIAVRVYGDPRRTRETMDLYDEAKGIEGAAQESYTGRGRRFPKMRS